MSSGQVFNFNRRVSQRKSSVINDSACARATGRAQPVVLARPDARLTACGRADPAVRTRTPMSSGLALSGGGVRSAAFCLGALQALNEADVLKKVDYLSTVSGGGYIGMFVVRRFGIDARASFRSKVACRGRNRSRCNTCATIPIIYFRSGADRRLAQCVDLCAGPDGERHSDHAVSARRGGVDDRFVYRTRHSSTRESCSAYQCWTSVRHFALLCYHRSISA